MLFILSRVSHIAMNPVSDYGGGSRQIQEAVSYIQRGITIVLLYPGDKPDQRTLSVRRETGQVVWYHPMSASGSQDGHPDEGAIEIREIKEVRVGKFARDFMRWLEDTKQHECSNCLTIFYGTGSTLRSVSFAAHTVKDTEAWVEGLRFLVDEAKNAPYRQQVDRWLRKEVYGLENSRKE